MWCRCTALKPHQSNSPICGLIGLCSCVAITTKLVQWKERTSSHCGLGKFHPAACFGLETSCWEKQLSCSISKVQNLQRIKWNGTSQVAKSSKPPSATFTTVSWHYLQQIDTQASAHLDKYTSYLTSPSTSDKKAESATPLSQKAGPPTFWPLSSTP